jgi:hypothetical protein
MEKLIDETLEIAHKYFIDLGFKDDQVTPLLASGKRDITNELNKLKELLEEDKIEIDVLNLSLHALKGLFLMMGNIIIADKLNELRQENEMQNNIIEIQKVLSI